MATETEICNVALLSIGEETINDIAENTHCKLYYPSCRDYLLRKHTWNFAEKRAKLGKTAAGALFEYTNKFFLPADYVKAIRLYNNEEDYRIEGQYLLSNSDEINLIYTAKIQDPNEFDDMFRAALELRLAAYLALSMKGSNSLFDQLRTYSKEECFMGQVKDAQEGTPINQSLRNNILTTRRGRR